MTDSDNEEWLELLADMCGMDHMEVLTQWLEFEVNGDFSACCSIFHLEKIMSY